MKKKKTDTIMGFKVICCEDVPANTMIMTSVTAEDFFNLDKNTLKEKIEKQSCVIKVNVEKR